MKRKITLTFVADLSAEEGDKEILSYMELIAKMQVNAWLGHNKYDKVSDVEVKSEEIG